MNNTLASALRAIVLGVVMTAAIGCSHNGGASSQGPQGSKQSGSVGYIDMDAVVKSHPLYSQLDALQNQITVLRQQSVAVPSGMSAEQSAAYGAMQRDLDAAASKFQADLSVRRDFYQRREAAAIGQVQAAALGQSSSGTVLGGLQQQYGAQAKQLQKQVFDTLTAYRNELFRQDGQHLKAVQEQLGADVRAKTRERTSMLSTAETKYQIELAKADQDERLNLQAKLQNLALSDKDRATDNARLQNIDAREQSLINQMKARDNAELTSYEKQMSAQATAKYEVERKATQTATQAKLMARQSEVQSQMAPQMQALGGKFQQQLSAVNQKLADNPKYRAQATSIHNEMQSRYVAEAGTAEASYRDTRKSLIAKYSAIAHMQFQDNEAIAAQVDKLAADRRDLFQKIAEQVHVQVEQISTQRGIAVVFASVRGPGSAVDLTDQVKKAISAQSATVAPTSTHSGGS